MNLIEKGNSDLMNLMYKKQTPSAFRVIAIISTYNEEDIIVPVINHLFNQEIDVYLMDNWSTDRTIEFARQFEPKILGIEHFPQHGPSPTFDWEEILKRKEVLSQELNADWFMHYDADEIRESPWKDIKLRDAIYLVDQHGYNAIDFTLLNFFPIDNNFKPGSNLAQRLKYFQFNDLPGNEMQIKAWKKNTERVNLWETGGHSVKFLNRKVFPYKFIMRHYPIRSQSHGEKKVITERILRYNTGEREKGWHTQYNDYLKSTSFLKRPKELFRLEPDFYNYFLFDQMMEQERVAQSLNNRLVEIQEHLADNQRQLKECNREIAEIKESKAWKMATFIRRIYRGMLKKIQIIVVLLMGSICVLLILNCTLVKHA